MRTMLTLAVVALLALGNDGLEETCVRGAQNHVRPARGRVASTLYAGGCAHSARAPQVVLDFPHGRGVAVLGTQASRNVVRMEWHDPGHLELVYRASRSHGPVARTVELDGLRVVVSYRTVPFGKTSFTGAHQR